MTRSDMPRRVYLRHGRYFYVTHAGKWLPLTRERDGLPAMYRALAEVTDADHQRDRMPAVISRWLVEMKAEWAAKTWRDQERIGHRVSQAFAEFTPAQVTTAVCAQYLRTLHDTARTHNLHRTMLRQVLAFAAREGLRDGANPLDNIPQRRTPGRKRLVTDAEVRAIRDAALAGRYGRGLVQMIDIALLTGQRIGDLINMRWQDVTDDGIQVTQGKGGERLVIEWSPALRAAVEACAEGRQRIGHLLKTETGGSYTYAGMRSAWVRACAKAGVADLNIHDLRGRAGMDKRAADGLEAAKDLLGHRSVKMTEHYVDGKAPRRVKPAR